MQAAAFSHAVLVLQVVLVGVHLVSSSTSHHMITGMTPSRMPAAVPVQHSDLVRILLLSHLLLEKTSRSTRKRAVISTKKVMK